MRIIDTLRLESLSMDPECLPGGSRFRFMNRKWRRGLNKKLTSMAKYVVAVQLESLRKSHPRGLDARLTTIKEIVHVARGDSQPFDFLVKFSDKNVRLRVEISPVAPILKRVKEMIYETGTVVMYVHLRQEEDSVRKNLINCLMIGVRKYERSRQNGREGFCFPAIRAA